RLRAQRPPAPRRDRPAGRQPPPDGLHADLLDLEDRGGVGARYAARRFGVPTVIARLDVPQRQVAVDAVVMDVTIENNFGLTVDLASLGGEDGFAVTNTANILQVAGTAQQLANPGALALGVLGLGSTGGVTTGIFSDLDVDLGNGQTISVPFVPLLIKATEKLTDVEVLSEPSLVTVDNEEASILVGQEVPFITSTSRPNTDQDGTAQGFSSGFTRVQREEVGIKLKVTPQISEGDNVLLEIELESPTPTPPRSVPSTSSDRRPTSRSSRTRSSCAMATPPSSPASSGTAPSAKTPRPPSWAMFPCSAGCSAASPTRAKNATWSSWSPRTSSRKASTTSASRSTR
ncbi:MAG: hypothetical protein HC888_18600, partial [Candidatus Competibacteraceae bacterium]|nr:hypothetical protein [Candidatus Competibacteraceae bacterium]